MEKKRRALYNDVLVPEYIYHAACIETYDGATLPTFSSVTGLLKPVKIFWGSKKLFDETKGTKNPLVLPVSTQLYSMDGAAQHSFMEWALLGDPRYAVEQRMYLSFKIGDRILTISGMTDLYVFSQEKLVDYKNMSCAKYNRGVGKANFMGNKAGFPDYEAQLNIYAYMMNSKTVTDGNGVSLAGKFPVRQLGICTKLRDWSRMAKIKQPTLPKSMYEEIGIPLWPRAKTEAFIIGALKELLKYEGKLINDIPACSATDRWQKAGTYPVFKYDYNKGVITGKRAESGTAKLTSPDKAMDWIANKVGGVSLLAPEALGYTIVEKLNDPLRCQEYCILSQMGRCNYWNSIKDKYK